MRELIYTLIGFAIAAIPPAVAFALTSPGLGGGFNAGIQSLFFLSALFYVYSVFFTVVLGGLSYLALRKAGLINAKSAMIGGCLIGLLVSVLIILPNNPVAVGNLDAFVMCGAVGTFSGLIFWLIWKAGMESKSPFQAGGRDA